MPAQRCVLEALRVILSNGPEHNEFAAVMDSQSQFLKLPPPVPDYFPVWWKAARLALECQSVNGPNDFWSLVSCGQMEELGVKAQDMAGDQNKIVVQKLVWTTKMQDTDAVACALSNFFEEEEVNVVLLSESVKEHVAVVQKLACSDKYTGEQVKQALANQKSAAERLDFESFNHSP